MHSDRHCYNTVVPDLHWTYDSEHDHLSRSCRNGCGEPYMILSISDYRHAQPVQGHKFVGSGQETAEIQTLELRLELAVAIQRYGHQACSEPEHSKETTIFAAFLELLGVVEPCSQQRHVWKVKYKYLHCCGVVSTLLVIFTKIDSAPTEHHSRLKLLPGYITTHGEHVEPCEHVARRTAN
jgi:hypothetical protein